MLNKIDALEDPLASAGEVEAQIALQLRDTARTLGVAANRVFPISARQALAARVAGDAMALNESRLPVLEAALGAQLLPQRRQVLEQVVQEGARSRSRATSAATSATGGASSPSRCSSCAACAARTAPSVRLMLKRVEAETAEFEECTTLLQAMRSIHARMLKDMLVDLSSDRLRDEVAEMQSSMGASLLNLGAKRAFGALCERLRGLLASAQRRNGEIREMLGATFGRLNAEYGFSLALGKPLDFDRFTGELQLIESNYVQYLGLTLALRLAQPKFMEQFRRMLVSKLRVVFENASSELELWNKAVSAQVDAQLRERRKGFKRRRETLEKIQIGRRRARVAARRDRGAGRAPAAVPRPHRRAGRGAARARLRGAAGDRSRPAQDRPAAL